METTSYAGIDYSSGQANRDKETGIRYGIIPEGATDGTFFDAAEADYGNPTCPKCGGEALDYNTIQDELEDEINSRGEPHGTDYYCKPCLYSFWSERAFSEEALGHNLQNEEYSLHMGQSDARTVKKNVPSRIAKRASLSCRIRPFFLRQINVIA